MGSNMGNAIFNPINHKGPEPNYKTLAENEPLDKIINILGQLPTHGRADVVGLQDT